MIISNKKYMWIALVSILTGAFLTGLYLNEEFLKTHPFFTTTSPNGNYVVKLTGQKDRPIFFTVEVHFDVLKKGKMYILDQYLHSGDSMDVSFESGYPNHRWLDDNILQFYEGKIVESDKITVINNTDKIIKYLKIFSQDKFLLFDIQPFSKTKLANSPSRGDIKGIYVEGEYVNGRLFKKGISFPLKKDFQEISNYYIYIADTNLKIEKQ